MKFDQARLLNITVNVGTLKIRLELTSEYVMVQCNGPNLTSQQVMKIQEFEQYEVHVRPRRRVIQRRNDVLGARMTHVNTHG